MKIGGLQPVTLLDYPQKVAAIIFAAGCNMRCPFCYNPTLVRPEIIEQNKGIPEDELLAFLKKRKKYLDGVVITGGEPTLQSDIADFCRKIKKMGYAIKLDTNGLLPDVLSRLIAERLIDYIAMDIKGPLARYSDFCGVDTESGIIESSIKIIKQSSMPYEFRSTLVKGLHGQKDVLVMAEAIAGSPQYFLQNFSRQDKLVGDDFEGRSFRKQELADFCKIASKYVKNCQIR